MFRMPCCATCHAPCHPGRCPSRHTRNARAVLSDAGAVLVTTFFGGTSGACRVVRQCVIKGMRNDGCDGFFGEWRCPKSSSNFEMPWHHALRLLTSMRFETVTRSVCAWGTTRCSWMFASRIINGVIELRHASKVATPHDRVRGHRPRLVASAAAGNNKPMEHF